MARRNLLYPWAISLVVALIYVGIILASHVWNPLALTADYDGQFCYYIALNPIDAWKDIDVPSYRYQRILYPLLSRLIVFGNLHLIPWSLLFVNLAALALGTYLTEKLLEHFGVGPSYAIVYGLYAGLLFAVRLDLNEPLAQALTQGGIYAYEKKRGFWGALLFGMATLTKETGALFIAGYALAFLLIGQKKRLGELIFLAFGPFALYQLFLKWWLGDFGIGSGGAGATSFTIIPFGGLLEVGSAGLKVMALWLAILGPFLLAPLIVLLFSSLNYFARGGRHPIAFCLVMNALALVFLPFSTYREFLAMWRITVGFMASTLLYGALLKERRILRYSLLWLALLVFLFKE